MADPVGPTVREAADATSPVVDGVIQAMAMLADTRDTDGANHIQRIQRYVRALAWKLSNHPRFQPVLTVPFIGWLFKAAPLHDIGKVCIPDRILLKPGRLTPEEFDVMKTHTTLGRRAIDHAQTVAGGDVLLLRIAAEITESHHEKWDGSGYPQGLAGDAIPVSARLMAVADVYDALISRKVYKEPMPHAQAVEVITQVRGKHFDPDVVDAFLALEQQFHAIAVSYSDSGADLQKKRDYLELAQLGGPPITVPAELGKS
ncbi:HD domain-containing phosphohydrolase [Curvibacter sp. APW13]|uniref:HD-GYP domain-containing protein n=1 Tax=Curvibacter sp. APW13 TaxID=3077236 RepID=UPI0028DE7311|nr:HD domain-containing phosphohydrolase [Curvibacter sp. APW13]MDT8992154.1 HD domain-containing phosphohydrolase [Curvibacter sp. APW13]